MDWDKIGLLMRIIDLARSWPSLKAIHDLAMQDLNEIVEEAEEELEKRAKEKEEEAA